jgi:two-component system, chemotaxis family, chemotaxis protein CheY
VDKVILAVDDSRSLRQMVCFSLKAAGYKVVEAADGVEALKLSQGTTFDLVLTDQNMPNMDGLTLIRRLRASETYKSIPILMLTTESSDEMKLQGRSAGATGWLVKPFDPAKLVAIVQKVVG